MKPIIVITVMGGLVAEVTATAPIVVFVEDWDCPPDRPLVMDFESEPLTADQERRVTERLAEANDQQAAFDARAKAACSAATPPHDLPKRFDDYEIQPCRRFREDHDPERCYYEVCEPHEADVWTLYGHIPGEGVEAIGDFDRREHAEEVYARITGHRYGL